MATSVTSLLTAATAVGAGQSYKLPEDKTEFRFQCRGSTSSSTGLAQVDVEVSDDGTGWSVLGSFSLDLTTTSAGTAQALVSSVKWGMARGKVTSITGTGANVTLTMGV